MFGAMTYAELGRHEAASRRRVHLHSRCLRSAARISLRLDVVRHRQACIDRNHDDRTGPHPRHLQRAFIPESAAAIVKPFAITYGQLVAILAAALITGLNYLGVKKAGEFQLVFTVLKIAMIVAIAVSGFTAASGTWSNFASSSPAPQAALLASSPLSSPRCGPTTDGTT